MYSAIRTLGFAAISTFFWDAVIAQTPAPLPIVDLGYELHRAAEYNETAQYYKFSNIRYAAPPLGDLRFRAPAPPIVNQSFIQDGLQSRICPQTHAPWLSAVGWISNYVLSGTLPNVTTNADIGTNGSSHTPRDPDQSEDCLLLDVFVPRGIFEKAGHGYGASVLVWIHGGGYASGSKHAGYDPRSLLKRSQTNGSEGIIFLAMNYRLGALGFLAGPSFQETGTANAGFHDQRMALEWVQEHIHLFGGDKNRVTVIGESAGGGSIIHHITAYGGRFPAPFQQAIIQSPGWIPTLSMYEQENRFQDFLRFANVSSLGQARTLSTDSIMDANNNQIAASSYGNLGSGPSVDGNLVPQDPKLLLRDGKFDKSVRVMVGHNADEGLLVTPPLRENAEYVNFIRGYFPGIQDPVLDHITNVIYPPIFNGSMPYVDQTGRAALTVSEGTFVANTFAMNRAYGNKTFAYLFDIFPALHVQDVEYTFYNPDVSWQGFPDYSVWGDNQTVAYTMQDYFTSFATQGIPKSSISGVQAFPMYGDNSTVIAFSKHGIGRASDPAANERCAWWQSVLLG